jgi:hypothetical protein
MLPQRVYAVEESAALLNPFEKGMRPLNELPLLATSGRTLADVIENRLRLGHVAGGLPRKVRLALLPGITPALMDEPGKKTQAHPQGDHAKK